MIVHREFEQGSLAWMCARAGIPTASEFHNLVTPKWEVRKGLGPQTYLAMKLAEKWIGGPLPGFSSWATEAGHILEDEALPWASLTLEVDIERVGFITTDDGLAGCSPDGMLAETGIEIKCPEPTNHVKYLLGGRVPDEYLPQVQGSIYVTGADRWRFLSYSRRFPKLLLIVESNLEAQEAIAEALELFHSRFEAAWAKMVDLNGGPPPKRKPLPADAARARFDDELSEVVP